MLEKTSAEIFHYNGQTGTTTRTELLFWLRLKTWDLRMYLTFQLIWKKLHEDSFSLYINSTQPEGLILGIGSSPFQMKWRGSLSIIYDR